MRKIRASYTVEAAILIPMVFIFIAVSVKVGVSLHENVKQSAENYANMKEIDAVKMIRNMKNIKSVLEG